MFPVWKAAVWRIARRASSYRSTRAFNSSTGKMQRDYDDAIAALNTLQSNFSIVDAIKKSGRGMNKNAIPEMIEWCRRIGYEPSDFNGLNAIHVAGTKGKGSTSAFISSILRQYLPSGPELFGYNEISVPSSLSKPKCPTKVGLYTSPHLRSVRERIQINSQPLSEVLFAHYFFDVWDRLEASASRLDLPTSSKPVYFRFLTLMAFHTYLCEGVDTAVIECGIGGEYDSTNIIECPTVSAVTSLGIDHTAMLGDKVEEIAWHKAGIFKSVSKTGQAFTVASQPPEAMAVLQRRAEERGVQLIAVPPHPDIENGNIKLGLAADFQHINASLAVSVAAAHLRSLGVPGVPEPCSKEPLPNKFKRGLETVQWGGRCETRRQGNVVWHLDGGHTIESIRLAAGWLASCISTEQGDATRKNTTCKRILLFNQQTRDAPALARALHLALSQALPPKDEETPLFTHALFSTNITFAAAPEASDSANTSTPTGSLPPAGGGRYKPDLISMNTSASDVLALTVQRNLAATWQELDAGAKVSVFGTVEEAVREVERVAKVAEEHHQRDVVVFVTGSLHLVGGVLEVLETVGTGGL